MSPARRSVSAEFCVRVWRLWETRATGAIPEPRGRLLGLFAPATLVQSTANGVMATCAGLLGQALVNPTQIATPGANVDPRAGSFSPLLLCFVGFAAALVKTGAGTISAFAQKQAA